MSFPRFVRVGLIFGFVTGALSMGGSCYRAEIDLTPLLDDMTEGGVGTSGGANESSGTGGALPMIVGGAGGADAPSGTGGVGGDAETCDDTPLDAVQAQCRGLLRPTAADCHEGDPAGWNGCYAGGCVVCADQLVDFPYYIKWHPCCEPNSTCNRGISPVTCNVRCPPPTEHDKVAPCSSILP